LRQTKKISAVAIAACALACLASMCQATTTASQPVAAIKSSAYDRLDQTKLADSLGAIGLTDMLATLAEESESTNPALALYARAEIALCQAKGVLQEGNKFFSLMDQATAMLQQSADLLAKSADEYSLPALYRVKLKLADAQAILYCQSAMERLFLLQGGAEDRKFILDHTKKNLADLSQLGEAIDHTLKGWRDKSQAGIMVVLGPAMEELAGMAAYKLAYAELCRGMAMDDRDQAGRVKLLLAARMAVGGIVKDTGNETGLQYWALLLSGQASRELKDFDRALADLKQACSSLAPGPVRVAAGFETVRTLVEKQDFEQAKAQVEVFRKDSAAWLGESGGVGIDVQYALLKNYLYDRWAESIGAKDVIAENACQRYAQEALLQFIAEHPDDQYAFCKLVASRYQGQTDFAGARPTTLCVLAISQRLRYPDGDPRRPPALQKAEELLQTALAASGPLAQQVRPIAMFNQAVIKSQQGKAQQAGLDFVALASQYPTHPQAYTSICNAATIYNDIIQAKTTAGQPASTDDRQALAGAIELMLSRPEWAEKPKAKQWCFSLAWQYDKLAEAADEKDRPALLQKAIQAYQAAASTQGTEQMQARQLALLNQTKLLGTIADSDKSTAQAKRRQEAGKLLPMLQAFVADAAGAAESADRAGLKEQADQLRQLAGLAEFQQALVMHDYLDQQDAAVAILRAIPHRWPACPAVQQSDKYLIGLAIGANDTTRALGMIEDYRQKYPQDAPAMLRLAEDHLSQRIDQLRYDATDGNELSRYRLAYGKFADILYQQQASSAGTDAEAMYPYKQLAAGGKLETALALLAGNSASQDRQEADKLLNEALELFTQCQAYDDARRDQQARQIDEKYSLLLAELRQPALDADKLQASAREFLAQAQAGADAQALILAVRKCLDASTKAAWQTKKGLAELRKSLEDAYTDWPGVLKRRLPIDAINLWGLARTNRAIGNFERAMEIFKELSAGLGRGDKQRAGLSWRAELEYCQCTMEYCAFLADSQQACENLVTRIAQLKMDNPGDMGGLAKQFAVIQAQAQSLSEQK
jgi:hypothetical protein